MKLHTLALLTLSALTLAACKDDAPVNESEDSTPVGGDSSVTVTDADADGVTPADGDCDDANPAVYPGRTEDCNGVDDNCNSIIDEGFGDADNDKTADCVDAEDCDGIDNDGDGVADEGFGDADGDGIADCVGTEICDGVDNNGDGRVDEGYDADGDGFTQCNEDCNDADPSAYPGASEVGGDGSDNDCDGSIDEEGLAESSIWFTEIMVNPAKVTDPKGEWIELHNPGTEPVYLNGLTLTSSSGESHIITSASPLEIAAGDFFVLGLNKDKSTNGGVTVDYVYTGIALSNESDEIALTFDGTTIARLAWDDGATMPDPDGASVMVDPTAYGTDESNYTAWCAATKVWASSMDKGSPGSENEPCSTFDHDGDGFTGDMGDCDDYDLEVYPGAPEIDAAKDNDCDGVAELMPVAVAASIASSSLVHCDYLYLDGSGSTDESGAALTYAWELVSAPSGSQATTADITSTTSQMPTFTPDLPGTYIFALTVNDGGTNSLPTTLTVTIGTQTTNTLPVANAGADQSASESVTCQAFSYGAYYTCDDCSDYDYELSALGSADANSPDHMTYAWSFVSGSTYATIDDATSATPTVTVSGVPATQGTTNSQGIQLLLTVTDCYGGTATDTVSLTFACTGT